MTMGNSFDSSKGKLAYQFINKNSTKHLLLIHGFIEDHEVWNGIIQDIDCNIILVDMLGFGDSIPNAGFDFSMYQHAVSLNELLDHLQPQDLYVLGHSMGGYVTLELSLLYPDLNIGLLHSTCVEDNEEKKLNRNKTIEVLQREPSVFIREFYWNLFAEHHKTQFTEIIEELRKKAENIPVNYIIETVKGLRDRKDHTKTWELAGGKNTIIAGKFDKLMPIDDLEELAFLAGADFVELADSGHMGFYEEPEGLITAIRLWMELED
jgi:pimeloyl-ACP methyl ester carboxylesterase